MVQRFLVMLFSGALLLSGACAHSNIPGTQVRDTEQNREIYTILVKIRVALEERDASTLLSLVSPRYFEDFGTPDPRDDFGYVELKEKLLKDTMDTTKEMHVSIELHEIAIEGEYAYADVRYDSRARLELPAGRLWDTHTDFDRLRFHREDNAWKIISGL